MKSQTRLMEIDWKDNERGVRDHAPAKDGANRVYFESRKVNPIFSEELLDHVALNGILYQEENSFQ